ncbi:MAG: YihY/virulence factor BrkB family protein [Alphaproteobacteria bacterium]|nr:YihY/virulence factor BrkB family protein [Alphaproteobacteria bacterium]
MNRTRTFLSSIYRLYEHSGFAMAGAVAFSFVVSLFPFCIFVGALSGIFGGRELATVAVSQLFQILPPTVASALAPEVESVMGSSRIDLLTAGGFIALFFATTAVETLRTALNGAYRVQETAPYVVSLFKSMVVVCLSAISMLVITWIILVGPGFAARFEPSWFKTLLDSTWLAVFTRYGLAAAVIATLLFVFHLGLAAGSRRIKDVWPGVAVSTVLWLAVAGLYTFYLEYSNYAKFYAGLSQLMIALIFFQFTAIIVILGAEINRGILEFDKVTNGSSESGMPATSDA